MPPNPLFEYCLRLGDNTLIAGHRLSEWCGHGPILEEDIALTNISLDLIGQARWLLAYAAESEGGGRTEDDLAYLRDVLDFRNALLVEQPNGDYGNTIAKQFLFSAFQVLSYEALQKSADKRLKEISEKSLKESKYHFRHCSEWLLRLGGGTDESRHRVQKGLNDLWMFTDDLFEMTGEDKILLKQGIATDMAGIKNLWKKLVIDWIIKAGLTIPDGDIYMMTGSRFGKHTEHLGHVLAEMQFLQRAYPGAKW